MTCIYEGLGANATARDQAMQLVLTHHFSLTPDSSNLAFERSVAALLLADVTLFGGSHNALIQGCAFDRGLITQLQLPTPTLTAPADGAVLEVGSPVQITWNTNGAPAGTVYQIEYSSACTATVVSSETFESGANSWTVSHTGGTLDWTLVTDDAHSATHCWFAGDEAGTNDQYLVSPSLAIGANQQLSFWHKYNLEEGYDGGQVEISTNGGGSWASLGPQMTQNPYNGTSSAGAAFTGNSGGWIETRADLSSFAGQNAQLRFHESDDVSFAEAGWWVDDVAILTQVAWTPLTTTAADATSYAWNAPATPASYCIRVRGQHAGYIDSEYSAVRTFRLSSNTPPTISAIGNQTIAAGGVAGPLNFTISDAQTAAGSLTLSGSSSDTTLVPNASITFGGSGASRTATVTPAAGQTGTATITITVSDGEESASASFTLTVQEGQPASYSIYLPLGVRP
jgi:hypothetical protein